MSGRDGKPNGRKGMSAGVERKINSFLSRKEAEFPELIRSVRRGQRTVKYAAKLRSTGQLLLVR